MPSRPLFHLRDVPDDEALAVRTLLSDNSIEFYETSGGNWGVSMPALWVRDDDDFARARALIDDYQRQLVRQPDETSGRAPIVGHPLRAIIFVLIAVAVVYFSIRPFLTFGQ